ncbi:GNAT family N-acetyltransferase [Marinomonas sp. 15G1-11]|uniref:GNAT family N-acetyltransferase n=1 Tax=Marinomonas phaeophyticola TaxID=3004091 RepID=A0ABT4JQQ8_9GAMM|nr:GNAT family N-acetyltransferase [Marinomonas sp. 15G1-11]MCZ2720664.1 GNAT family N-acetyltransferase [Marinomonas sp. 15G1-11]
MHLNKIEETDHLPLETERLLLRQWQGKDLEPFAEMTADSLVMEHFPSTLTRSESDELVCKLRHHIDQRGWGFWAVERKDTHAFIGFVGIIYQAAAMPNAPFVEIGWRISSNHWRKGYALEAAQASLKFAFETLAADSVYAITNLNNLPSIGVMKKLGMKNQDQDFDHPALPKEHPLARHCLYGITRDTALFK